LRATDGLGTDHALSRRMDSKTYVITGASDGIGRALALRFVNEGANVVVAARSAAGLDETLRLAGTGRERMLAVPTDVADPDACAQLVVRAVERFSGIDVLVNNAGISMQARVDAVTDLAVFERLMRVNYLGAVYCTSAALPHLVARRGLVVAVSSLQGKTGFPTYAGYCASKHAMQGFFDSLRIELRDQGVDVLVASPGPVDTAIHERRLSADGMHHHGRRPRARSSMPVDECARQIARAIARRDRELVMTVAGKAGQWLRLVAPGLLDRLIADAIRRFDAAS
jgi:NAD(P)-dependent dehydrogenase (short-subunit alcohol dehydrogenase family)